METLYDVIIIGSGPAGLAAAIYARRACLESLVLEKEYMSGGQVLNTYEVDNYPGLPGIGGFDLGMKMKEHADQLGAVFVTGAVKAVRRESSIIIVETAKATYRTKTMIIAAGAGHRKLGIPGEEKFAGRGVSYCATCDGAFYAGGHVIVVGGGNSAAAEALQLAETSETVTILQDMPTLTCEKNTAEKIYGTDNIEVITNVKVLSFFSDGDKIGAEIADGVTGETRKITANGVFEAIGLAPDNEAFQNLVALDRGYVQADDSCTTSTPGIFTAGDCRTKAFRQITTACADGTAAALAACAYLQ